MLSVVAHLAILVGPVSLLAEITELHPLTIGTLPVTGALHDAETAPLVGSTLDEMTVTEGVAKHAGGP